MAKHVIFLGAGASVTSGYPAASELTLRMVDRLTFHKHLVDVFRREAGYTPESDGLARVMEDKSNAFLRYFDKFEEARVALRYGNFSTMDELSHWAFGSDDHIQKVLDLKTLLRYIFALENPGSFHYATSDYRPFIQNLFESDRSRLGHLRNDVCVISFNYDPYFEFNLLRTFYTRADLHTVPPDEFQRLRLAITSGFVKASDHSWLDQPGFSHLKLHGVCAFPDWRAPKDTFTPPGDDPRPINSWDFFRRGIVDKLSRLQNADREHPPILLPWEIIHEDGHLLTEEEFSKRIAEEWQHRNLYPLFAGLWRRARHEVQEADKISFVGLSIGPFMEPEFKYLFDGKKGRTVGVIATPENKTFRDMPIMHPRSPRGRCARVLKRIAPGIQLVKSRSDEPNPVFLDHLGYMTTRDDFSDFIEWEMGA